MVLQPGGCGRVGRRRTYFPVEATHQGGLYVLNTHLAMLTGMEPRARFWPWAAAGSRWSPTTRCSTTSCSRWPAGRRPRVCFVGPPAATRPATSSRFHARSRQPRRAASLSLFRRDGGRPADVPARAGRGLRRRREHREPARRSGGSTASDRPASRPEGGGGARRRQRGMICWFEGCVTDSFGAAASPARSTASACCPGSACPHYDGEAQRRPTYRELVGGGGFPGGYAVDDGCALAVPGRRAERTLLSSRQRGGRLPRGARRGAGCGASPSRRGTSGLRHTRRGRGCSAVWCASSALDLQDR